MPQAASKPTDDLEQFRRDQRLYRAWSTITELLRDAETTHFTHCIGIMFDFIGDNGTITAGIIDNIEFHPQKLLRLSAGTQLYEWMWDEESSTWGRCSFSSRIWVGELGDFKARPLP